jgi:hypothetical protein
MPISINDLRAAAARSYRTAVFESAKAALAKSKQTAFLCHSHKDEDLAKGLQVLLAENGWDLYLDWQDHQMPEQPNKETAVKIKSRIGELDWFLFLATPNSTQSRWCPWEIGYADSKKPHDRILVIPTTDAGKWYGNEYLQLYRKISDTQSGGLAAFSVGQNTGGVLLKTLR